MNKYKITYPGLEDMIITKEELVEGTYQIHLERQRTPSRCPRCTHMTSKVHDYRMQKIQNCLNDLRFYFIEKEDMLVLVVNALQNM